MTTEQFNQMKGVMEFDLSIYLATMINSRMFNNVQVLEMGAFVGASYTHFSKTENIQFSDQDKMNIKQYLCDFYSKNIRSGISDAEKNVIRKKYDELLNTDNSIIQSYLQKIANLAIK